MANTSSSQQPATGVPDISILDVSPRKIVHDWNSGKKTTIAILQLSNPAIGSEQAEPTRVVVLLNQLKIPLTTSIDNVTKEAWGLELMPYPSISVLRDVKKFLLVMKSIVKEVFAEFSSTSSLNSDISVKIKTILSSNFTNQQPISFITFSHPTLRHNDILDIDQRGELKSQLAPTIEQPRIIPNSRLELDIELLDTHHVFLLYDSSLKTSGSKNMSDIEQIQLSLIGEHELGTPTLENPKDSKSVTNRQQEQTYNEAKQLMPFQAFQKKKTRTGNKRLCEGTVDILALVHKNLLDIQYDRKGNTVSMVLDGTPIKIDNISVLDWNSLNANTEVSASGKDQFKNAFSNDYYSMSIDVADNRATITPASFVQYI